MNILMIEDNESVSEMMQMFFLNEGWEATFKDDGKEGLATFLASPEKWDMITLDLNLPSMDGMAVCREIRKVSANVPIIMFHLYSQTYHAQPLPPRHDDVELSSVQSKLMD